MWCLRHLQRVRGRHYEFAIVFQDRSVRVAAPGQSARAADADDGNGDDLP